MGICIVKIPTRIIVMMTIGTLVILSIGYAIDGLGTPTDVFQNNVENNKLSEWNKTFGGSENEYARALIETSDGGYLLAGYTESFGAGSGNMLLVKTDENGQEVWMKTFGGSAFSLIEASDSSYLLAGYISLFGTGTLDMWLVKTSSSAIVQKEFEQIIIIITIISGIIVTVVITGVLIRKYRFRIWNQRQERFPEINKSDIE